MIELANNAIRFPNREEGNPLYPLPPDYEQLSPEGQKLARINACCLQETPQDFVMAWDFFRRTYLFPTPPGFFYGHDLVESPPFHYEMVEAMASNQLAMMACPRGFGKSTVMDEIILLMALTHPGISVGLCLASDALVQERFSIYQKQLSENEYILADFGNQRPNKGEGIWNQHLLSMINLSRIRGFAVEGRKRGTKPRPLLMILDDPEYDPHSSTDTSKVRADFERLLFNVLINMGEKGMRMFWPGTVISKQSSIYNALTGDDPRFKRWNKRIVGAVRDNPITGQEEAVWPEYMNMDEIQAKRETIGASSFSSEYLNKPGIGADSTFVIDPELNQYFIQGDVGDQPLTSIENVVYTTKDRNSTETTKHEVPWGEFASKMFRIMTVDYAPTVKKSSDFSAIVVMGFERPGDILWVLDAWQGRVRDEALCRQVYAMGRKWWPRVVGIEAVSIQERLAEMVAAFLEDLQHEGSWHPKVLPIRYPSGVSKQDRIAGMEWRFNSHRVKLPGSFRGLRHWRTLYQQIEEFQADMMDGNLQHDDLVDAMAMYQQVTRSKVQARQEATEAVSDIDLLRSGQIIHPQTKIPIITSMNSSDLPPDVVQMLIARGGNPPKRSLAMRKFNVKGIDL